MNLVIEILHWIVYIMVAIIVIIVLLCWPAYQKHVVQWNRDHRN